jgi:hypothetical protein
MSGLVAQLGIHLGTKPVCRENLDHLTHGQVRQSPHGPWCLCRKHQRLKRLEAGPILDALPDRGPTVGQGRQAETGGSPISDIVDTGPGDCTTFVDEVGMP